MGWAGSVALGPQHKADIDRSRISWLSLNQKATAPFKLMVDMSRLPPPDSESTAAMGGDWMTAMAATMSPHLLAMAMALPPDWLSSLWGGLFLGHKSAFRLSVFGSRAEAWRYLEAAPEVSDTVDTLAAEMLREADLPALITKALQQDPSLVLATIAKDHGFSERGLQRALAARGETFANLRQRVRLELTDQFLSEGMQVKSAAMAVGFKSPSHFVAWYRRARGTTPGNRGLDNP